ncbi:MAG TPA: BMP family ABC transporter substrate-binding protein, partial [Actinomycetota bacterium]|nr:BMP family ABC transporter substrate-binding protein [Actinomycetota bacterium]
MRRVLRLAAWVSVVALVAAACSNKNTPSAGGTSGGGAKIKIGMVYDLAGRGDHSFNDSAFAGL